MGLMVSSGVVSSVPVELGGRDRLRLLLHTANMIKTQIRIKNITESRTPEIIPIFCVNALSMGKINFSTCNLTMAVCSYKMDRPSLDTCVPTHLISPPLSLRLALYFMVWRMSVVWS